MPASATPTTAATSAATVTRNAPARNAQPVRSVGPGGVPQPQGRHHQEDGTDRAGDDAGRDGHRRVRRDEGPQQYVRPEHQPGTGQTGHGQDRPGPGEAPEPAGERTYQRRGAQADEADGPGQRDGRRGQQRRQHHHRDAGGVHRDTQTARGVVPEGQRVDPAGDQQQPDEPTEVTGSICRTPSKAFWPMLPWFHW